MSKTDNTTPARRSKIDLLNEGLSHLCELGIETLTIDNLCKRLGVTKGSFYHHFQGRMDYLRQLLEHWVEEWTVKKIAKADRAKDPADKFRGMVAEAAGVPHGPETSIRAWAVRDPLARKYLEKVDALRTEYMRSIMEKYFDPERAKVLANIGISLYVGSRMVTPTLKVDDRMGIFTLISRELFGIPLTPDKEPS